MCKLSENLKLCTCGRKSLRKLDHYWVLHRFKEGKYDRVIGRVALPDRLGEKVEAYNRSLLLARLNEDDAFDVDLKPQEGDRLQLTFQCSERRRSKTITYGYAFTAGRWVEEPFDSLSWQWRHEVDRFGELRPALQG